jgi:hypothetical protein
MQFHLFLLFFFSHHQFIFIIVAYSNQNNSSINVDLYECNTNSTVLNRTANAMFNNLIDSCNTSCCISNSSSTCQVTVQSSSGICLGRLCYFGKCHDYVLLANMTSDYENNNNKTTITNKIHSSPYSIPWSSFVDSTQTKWSSWIDKTGLTIRRTILIILSIASLSLTFMTLIIVIKSIRQANMLADRKSYRYTLL